MTEKRTLHIESGDYREIHNQGQYADRDIVNLGESQQQTLTEAAAEIQDLLQQLEEAFSNGSAAATALFIPSSANISPPNTATPQSPQISMQGRS